MRPTLGRVSTQGAMAIAWSMDKLGPMARSADCCGLVLSVIGNDFHYTPSASPKPLRIGKLNNAWTRMAPGVGIGHRYRACSRWKGRRQR